jgi:3-dehydroquinate synthase
MIMEVSVNLPDKTYKVLIHRGLIHHLGNQLNRIWRPGKVAVISDSTVAPLYQDQVIRQLRTAGFLATGLKVPAGESSKSWQTAVTLYRALIDHHFTRSDGIVALGGGVIGDLAGFVASTYMRGIALVQVPTSLLAQVDSSVGGKTAVNLDTGKNIVGTFYQPDAVFIDPDTLETLPDRYIAEGYAEIVKMSALSGGSFWETTGQIYHPEDIVARAEVLIQKSVAFKARIVIADEKESGLRQILNFGHTIGHAIELQAKGRLAHGEAISIGMARLSQLFENYGLTKSGTSRSLIQRLQEVGLPLDSSLIGTSDFYHKIISDKKNHGGRLNLVYLKKPGEPALYPVRTDQLQLFFSGKNSLES